MARGSALGSVTHQLVQDLGEAIVTGEFADATSFPVEADICERYGASRSVVREAVKILGAKGLVASRPRRGTHVRDERDWNLLDPDVLGWLLRRRFSLPLLIEFMNMRLSIEPAAAAMAAQSADAAQHAKLTAAVARMAAAVEGHDDPMEADIDFHRSILTASNNRFFHHLGPFVATALRFAVRFNAAWSGAHAEDHRRIVRPIFERDPTAARAATAGLLEAALAEMTEALGATGETSSRTPVTTGG